MIERFFKNLFEKDSVAGGTLPETQYFIRVQDGDRFWVGEGDYLGFWKDASMLEVKRQVISGPEAQRTLSVVAPTEFQERWRGNGTLHQLGQKGINVVWAEEGEVLETPFPPLPQ